MENQKRYLVKCNFVIYADGDIHARTIVDNWAKNMDLNLDNRAQITGLYEIPFGKLESREVAL